MRKKFADKLHKKMKLNKDIYLVVGDLGYGWFDQIQKDFPDRFINVGAAEQSMLGVAVGLALEGKIPFVYTITSFYLRAAETINIYLHHEQIPVKLVGSGLLDDYKHDGYSHNGFASQDYLSRLSIEAYLPKSEDEVSDNLLKKIITNKKPSFLGLRR